MEAVLCGRADVVVVAHCYYYYRTIVSVFASLVACLIFSLVVEFVLYLS